MIATAKHAWYMTVRDMRNLIRQPWYVAFTLVQPIIYLLLFGAMFKRVVEIPGFSADSYITFLTPGIVVMTALFSAGWTGMSMVQDLHRGVMDRFLISPVHRSAVISGRLVGLSAVIVIQALILVGLGWVLGARFPGGLGSVAVLIVSAILLATPFGALSNGMALVARKEETVIAAVNFVMLPLTFLSAVFMAQRLMPGWMQHVARYNPVNWAVDAARAALSVHPDWAIVWSHLGFLLAFAVGCAWLATGAFRTYQRSV